jgi:hypothetical protein
MDRCKRCFATTAGSAPTGRDAVSICCFCEQLGRRVIHGCDGCPFLQRMEACRRCFQKGHLTKCCIIGRPECERPKSLEELIPYNLRKMYKIHTHTPITWIEMDRTTPDEIPPVNCFQVIDTYVGMKEFIELHNITVKKKTKESLDECRTAIEQWVKSRACRLEFVSPIVAVE